MSNMKMKVKANSPVSRYVIYLHVKPVKNIKAIKVSPKASPI